MTDLHSLACGRTDNHGPHPWKTETMTWQCLGTDDTLAVAWAAGRTIDNVPILHGMRLIDYNLDACTVIGVQSVSHGVVWYKTTTGMFDGQRLWFRMPRRAGS